MSQLFEVIDPSVPTGDTGTTMAQKVNDWRVSLLTMHSGSSRPAYVQAGTQWRDTTGSPWLIKMYDGAQDIILYEVNPSTHLITKIYFTPATAPQVLAGLATGIPIDPAGLESRMASVAQYLARTAGYIVQTNVAMGSLAEVTIPDTATIVLDMSTFINGKVTLAASRIMAKPTNSIDGLSGRIRIVQGSGGGKLITWATGWQFSGGVPPVLSTAAGAIDQLYYDILPDGDAFGSLVSDVKRPA